MKASKMRNLIPIFFTLMCCNTCLLAQSFLQGTWKGKSICQIRSSPCKDEEVVYHIAPEENSNKVVIDADKIVNGESLNMGTILFTYDNIKKTLTSENGPHLWVFNVEGNQMQGTLVSNGKLYRKVTLTKETQ